MSDIWLYLFNKYVTSIGILITAGHSTTSASGTSVSSTDILTQGKHCDYSVMLECIRSHQLALFLYRMAVLAIMYIASSIMHLAE